MRTIVSLYVLGLNFYQRWNYISKNRDYTCRGRYYNDYARFARN